MKLGKRTAKLLREAIVLAYVEGHHHGQYAERDEEFPKDSEIVRTVLISATRLEGQFPTLSRLDAAQKADEEYRRAFYGALKAEIAASRPAAPSPGDHTTQPTEGLPSIRLGDCQHRTHTPQDCPVQPTEGERNA